MRFYIFTISLFSFINLYLFPINYVLSDQKNIYSAANNKVLNKKEKFKTSNTYLNTKLSESTKDKYQFIELSKFNKSDYLLGPGDKLKILVYEPQSLTNTFEIMANGIAKVPFIGEFSLDNITLFKAKEIIGEKIEKDIINPYFDLILIQPRPLKITLIGQVESPGLYTLPFKVNSPINKLDKIETQVNSFKYHPTIVDLLKISGGVNHDSDVDNIEVIRRFKINNKIINRKTSISLLDLFLKGRSENNILLNDGDVIDIKKAKNIKSSSFNIIRANLLPKSIPIFVVGEVKNPGKYDVPINTSLVDAILIAGGPVNSRANRGKVRLQRVSNDGNFTNKRYKINYSNDRSEESNPLVKKNDIIFVNSTSLAKISDKLNILASPVTNILSIYTLLKVIED